MLTLIIIISFFKNLNPARFFQIITGLITLFLILIQHP
jgi:hypothetical protein